MLFYALHYISHQKNLASVAWWGSLTRSYVEKDEEEEEEEEEKNKKMTMEGCEVGKVKEDED